MTKTATHSPLPWTDTDEQCAVNHTVTDADGVPVLSLNPIHLRAHGEDKRRDANTRLVVVAVNNLDRLRHLLSTILRVVPTDTPGLPPDVLATAKTTLRDIEKKIGGS